MLLVGVEHRKSRAELPAQLQLHVLGLEALAHPHVEAGALGAVAEQALGEAQGHEHVGVVHALLNQKHAAGHDILLVKSLGGVDGQGFAARRVARIQQAQGAQAVVHGDAQLVLHPDADHGVLARAAAQAVVALPDGRVNGALPEVVFRQAAHLHHHLPVVVLQQDVVLNDFRDQGHAGRVL